MKQHSHLMADAAKAKSFALAGRARFTIVSVRTRKRYTYRVAKASDGKVYFVGLFEGTSRHEFMGVIDPRTGVYRHGQRSAIQSTDEAARAFDWMWKWLVAGRLPDSLEFWHEGKCGKCSRPLTDPESIETGFGPECRRRLAA